ncbi:hypothetical protein [Intrasporangium flavum]|uniref:hypothetical protein n=1 Tax=Intrasporangium flavum TaxID=1428657 RepID=UPI0009702165|nr:hypothetical protein [Intrasporangium flavum]
MPLPDNGIAWPPAELEPITRWMRIWDAWYVGDPDTLTTVYRGTPTAARIDRPAQYRGGIAGAAARFFWGRPVGDLQKPGTQLHIPLASDIARASADLLWSEAPAITVDDEATQKRLDELIDDGALHTLAEGAELGSALSGHYLKVAWDRTIRPDAPFLTLVDADAAWPEFRYGHLIGVTFWWVVARKGQKVTRHVERHELDSNGVGVILHGLYEGTEDKLGTKVPLTEHSSTAGLAEHIDQESSISTESPGLDVVYIPNVTPQRRWRNDPIGRHLGRSDLDGIEGLMDAVDEAWTSWMRDIRLGKARVFASRELLDSNGPGQGASLDLDREIFSPLGTAVGSLNPTGTGSANGFLMAQQFEIRYEAHQRTVSELVLTALRTAGYSAATFGEADGYGAAVTATEVSAREQRSLLTRDRKLRVARPRIADIIEKLLAVDKAIFGTAVVPARPDVQFPDGVQDSPLVLAQTAQALSGAEAASKKTLVAMIHPEWDDQQVDDEVKLIIEEAKALGLSDPLGGFAPPANPNDPTQQAGNLNGDTGGDPAVPAS